MAVDLEVSPSDMDITDLNMTEIQSIISNLTGIEADKLKIRVDLNEKMKLFISLLL